MNSSISIHRVEKIEIENIERNGKTGNHWRVIKITGKDGSMCEITVFGDDNPETLKVEI